MGKGHRIFQEYLQHETQVSINRKKKKRTKTVDAGNRRNLKITDNSRAKIIHPLKKESIHKYVFL